MHEVYHYVRWALIHYGYWAVIAGLLGEDAGLPLPGETTLMFAAFIAHKTAQLSLFWVIVVGIGAATAGDNIGFLLGRHFGKTLIRWLKKIARLDDLDVDAAKNLIKHHGGATVFFARFIFGLRTIAGPLAGMLGMEWKRFWIYNALGAALWVTVMSVVGYEFANQFNNLLDYFEKASWIIAAGLFTLGYFIWRRYKKHYREQHKEQQEPEAA
jgi:membrane protein DedA with SNARE-associated domain